MPLHGRLLPFLLTTLFALPAYGQESIVGPPTIGELVDSIPMLSTNNDKIRHARFTLTMWPDTATYPMRCDVQWQQNQAPGMLVSNTAWQCPFMFLSQKRGIYVVAPLHNLELMEDTQPRLVMRRSGDGVLCKIGNKDTESNLSIQVDLPGLVSQKVMHAAVKENADGNWWVRTLSADGGFDVTMTFHRYSPYLLLRFEMRSLLTGKVKYAVNNISINDDSLPPWPAFPDLKTIPENYTIHQDGEATLDDESLSKAVDMAMDKVKGMVATFGKDYLTEKNSAIAEQIDWEAVDRAHQQSAPVLRQAFGFQSSIVPGFPTMSR